VPIQQLYFLVNNFYLKKKKMLCKFYHYYISFHIILEKLISLIKY